MNAAIQQFNYPTTILFGPKAVAAFAGRLGGESRGGSFLLVTDPGVVKAGLAAAVTSALGQAGIPTEVFDAVHANPVEEDVTAGSAAFLKGGFSGIIALGGGSPMDVAKAIAVLATHDGPLERFDDAKGGDKLIIHPVPPIYAIPTTAGTGSEVGRSAVITIQRARSSPSSPPEGAVKTIIFHPSLLPRVAVLDPELTVGLPPLTTAATGMDAFTHGLESYFSKNFHPMADSIALGCMEIVIQTLPRVIKNGGDLDARGKMLLAASMGATAFQKGLGVVHSLAHPLSTRYGMHHGLTNALLMPPALSYQLEERGDAMTDDLRERYERVVCLFPRRSFAPLSAWMHGLERISAKPEDLPAAIEEFCREVGITDTLPGLGLRREDVPGLSREAFHDPCHSLNPIPMEVKDLEAIYERCL